VIVVINRLTVPAEYAAQLEGAFGSHSGGMKDVPGCKRFQLLRRSEGGEYLVLTEWQDRAAFEAWRQSDAFQRAHGGANPHSPVKSQLETYEIALDG
jgi:heme oxygenase (staphylobilin-producing)